MGNPGDEKYSEKVSPTKLIKSRTQAIEWLAILCIVANQSVGPPQPGRRVVCGNIIGQPFNLNLSATLPWRILYPNSRNLAKMLGIYRSESSNGTNNAAAASICASQQRVSTYSAMYARANSPQLPTFSAPVNSGQNQPPTGSLDYSNDPDLNKDPAALKRFFIQRHLTHHSMLDRRIPHGNQDEVSCAWKYMEAVSRKWFQNVPRFIPSYIQNRLVSQLSLWQTCRDDRDLLRKYTASQNSFKITQVI
jgi:hypothetical protein